MRPMLGLAEETGLFGDAVEEGAAVGIALLG